MKVELGTRNNGSEMVLLENKRSLVKINVERTTHGEIMC
jgi:hypothetical protein